MSDCCIGEYNLRERSRDCQVFWTNPGLSQAQNVKCSLRSNSGNKICFVDRRLTVPEAHREREG